MNELNNVPIIYIIVLEYFSKKRGHNFEELDTINVESKLNYASGVLKFWNIFSKSLKLSILIIM